MGTGEAMQSLAELQQVWTFDDLLALPEDVDRRRYEIVDGSLVVSPSTSMRHEAVSSRLVRLLDRVGLPRFETVGPIAIGLPPSYRVPDLITVSAETAATDVNPVPASDVLMVVEIVSPGSATTDRVTKPAQYAAAGIPTYLRVETSPDVTVTLYELHGTATVYTEVATWGPGQTARLTTPFAVDLPVDDLTP